MCKAVTISYQSPWSYCVDSVPDSAVTFSVSILLASDSSIDSRERLKGNARGLPDRLDPAYAARCQAESENTLVVL